MNDLNVVQGEIVSVTMTSEGVGRVVLVCRVSGLVRPPIEVEKAAWPSITKFPPIPHRLAQLTPRRVSTLKTVISQHASASCFPQVRDAGCLSLSNFHRIESILISDGSISVLASRRRPFVSSVVGSSCSALELSQRKMQPNNNPFYG